MHARQVTRFVSKRGDSGSSSNKILLSDCTYNFTSLSTRQHYSTTTTLHYHYIPHSSTSYVASLTESQHGSRDDHLLHLYAVITSRHPLPRISRSCDCRPPHAGPPDANSPPYLVRELSSDHLGHTTRYRSARPDCHHGRLFCAGKWEWGWQLRRNHPTGSKVRYYSRSSHQMKCAGRTDNVCV